MLHKALRDEISINNSTLSTPDDMLNEDGKEEIFVTAVKVKEGTNVTELVYAVDKSNNLTSNSGPSESESDDDIDKKRSKERFELG